MLATKQVYMHISPAQRVQHSIAVYTHPVKTQCFTLLPVAGGIALQSMLRPHHVVITCQSGPCVLHLAQTHMQQQLIESYAYNKETICARYTLQCVQNDDF